MAQERGALTGRVRVQGERGAGAAQKTLTLLDAQEGPEQTTQSIQEQLRSVLHAADERAPVSVQARLPCLRAAAASPV